MSSPRHASCRASLESMGLSCVCHNSATHLLCTITQQAVRRCRLASNHVAAISALTTGPASRIGDDLASL